MPKFEKIGKNLRKVDLDIESLETRFGTGVEISRLELEDWIREANPGVSESTISWRIHRMAQQGVFHRVVSGVYRMGKGNRFLPELSQGGRWLGSKLLREFPGIETCITEVRWLNEFLRHQISTAPLLIEVEKEMSEAVFYHLREEYPLVLWNPDRKQVAHYASGRSKVLVVQNLISRAPRQKIQTRKGRIGLPSLEKMLVDVFSDGVFFRSYVSESEMNTVFALALQRYSINFSTLFGYSRRRGNEALMKTYLSQNFPEKAEIILR